MLAFALLIGILPAQAGTWTPAASAAATAEELADFQADLDAALDSRPASFTPVYSGSVPTVTQISYALNNVFDADDYLRYVTKSFKIVISTSPGMWSVDFDFTYWETPAESADVATKVNDVLAAILTPGMNDFQKEKEIHDWIAENVAYDTTLSNQSAYAALNGDKKTSSLGYALLANKMLTGASIENKIAEGTVSGQKAYWNLAKLEGDWYHLDIAADDPAPDVPGQAKYDYFNLNDNQIKANHAWTRTYPAAGIDFADTLADRKVSDAANASFYTNLEAALRLEFLAPAKTVADADGVTSMIYAAMDSGQNSVAFRHTKKTRVALDLATAASKFANITGYTQTSSDFLPTTLTTDAIVTVNFTYDPRTAVTGVTVSPATGTVDVRSSLNLTATVEPAGASIKSVTWTSSDPAVATVNANGQVVGVGAGNAVITVTTLEGGLTATAAITVLQPATSIALDAKTKTLKAGDPDFQLNATVLPANATDKTVTWTSSNPAVATVDGSGLVHAVAAGTATITAKSANNLSAAAIITVPVAVTGVTLNKAAISIDINKTFKLVPTVAPTNAAVKTVAWTSSDPAVAAVNSTGTITAKSVGTATITATTTDGAITATSEITVVKPVTMLSLNTRNQTIRLGESDFTLTASAAPADATVKTVTWTSSKPAVATVDASGVVHAVAPGKTVITAKSVNGKSIAATITVVTPVTGITLNQTSLNLFTRKTAKLQAVIQPANATLKTVTWTTSDPLVATVSKAGVVSGKGPGTATITATTVDGSFTATATVQVTQPVTSVTFNVKSKTLTLGDPDFAITATVNPSNASDPTLIWTSSNVLVATVDSSGVVHPVGPGKTVIKATAVGGKYKAITVTVKAGQP